MNLKLFNATVDTVKIVGEGGKTTEHIIIRGIIDWATYDAVQVGPYQREVLPGEKATKLVEAVRTSSVPDLEFGMRGDRYSTDSSGAYTLKDPVFVIDGLQRLTAGKVVVSRHPDVQPRIGVMVHIDTTEEWEAERFRILNQDRTKINSNILLRNLRTRYAVVEMVLSLCSDPRFKLCNKVTWTQRMKRTELLQAMTLFRTLTYLHSRWGPGRGQGNPSDVAKAMQQNMENIGQGVMRDNVITFFEVIDECFGGLANIVFREPSPVLKANFLNCVADLFTRHEDFWKGKRLVVPTELRQKLAKFPMRDHEVVRLAGASGSASYLLLRLMVDHVNSGKRTRRLKEVPDLNFTPFDAREDDALAA